ncbi:leucine-rich repeat and calponin homology domain-containing protein 1 [Perca flavescens]|nr:leucine-rich repeat and calponin homology domain-containing protein 1-like [Perca flavescens]
MFFAECVSSIKDWLATNYLQINSNKTETLIFAPDHKIPLIKQHLGSLGPSVKSSLRNLGVVFDQAMSLETHSKQLVRNCFYHLRNILFLRSHKSLESVDPQFTMRRKMEQLREELELTELLRDSIESRLKVVLPEDLGSSLMDGVVLCHLANHIRPRSVGSIHVPSPAVPKLSMAKCRRNVENFLDACRKIGVPQVKTFL